MSVHTRRRPRLDTHRSGQAVVEFALIAPILLLIIFGLIDFARGWSAHHVIADAAREAVRTIVVANGQGQANATTVINERLSDSGLDPAKAVVNFDLEVGRGNPSTVTIDYEFDFWLLDVFMNWATGQETVHLVSRITMRNE